MKKYFYVSIAALAGFVLIVLIVVVQLDKTLLEPSKIASEPSRPHPLLAEKKNPPPPEVIPRQQSDTSPRIKRPASVGDDSQPSATTPNLRLAGTSVWGKAASAIIENLTEGTQKSYRLGDIVQGFEIKDISKKSVTLVKNGKEVVLEVTKGSAPPAPKELAWQIDENQWGLSTEQVAEKISNIDQYVGQVAVYQHYEGAEPSGFAVHHLAEGNDIEEMGIEDGDVIKAVNGLEMNDMTDVLKAVYELSDAREFQVEIERDNEIQTLTYELDADSDLLGPALYNLFDTMLGGGQ
jgi:general secretion pathway protein C